MPGQYLYRKILTGYAVEQISTPESESDGDAPTLPELTIYGNIPIEKLVSELKTAALERPQILGFPISEGRTGLILAVFAGRLDLVKELIEAGADPNTTDLNGDAPLHIAAARNRPDMIATLISAGAQIDIADAYNRSPLSRACMAGAIFAVRALMNVEAETGSPDSFGRVPYDYFAALPDKTREELNPEFSDALMQGKTAKAGRQEGQADPEIFSDPFFGYAYALRRLNIQFPFTPRPALSKVLFAALSIFIGMGLYAFIAVYSGWLGWLLLLVIGLAIFPYRHVRHQIPSFSKFAAGFYDNSRGRKRGAAGAQDAPDGPMEITGFSRFMRQATHDFRADLITQEIRKFRWPIGGTVFWHRLRLLPASMLGTAGTLLFFPVHVAAVMMKIPLLNEFLFRTVIGIAAVALLVVSWNLSFKVVGFLMPDVDMGLFSFLILIPLVIAALIGGPALAICVVGVLSLISSELFKGFIQRSKDIHSRVAERAMNELAAYIERILSQRNLNIANQLAQVRSEGSGGSNPAYLDSGRPISLFLRSFGIDQETNSYNEPFEDLIAHLMRGNSDFISIGNNPQGAGAIRVESSGSGWEDKVAEFAEAAQTIIMIPAPTKGVQRELEMLKEKAWLSKTIFIMPPSWIGTDGQARRSWNDLLDLPSFADWDFPGYVANGCIFRLNEDAKLDDWGFLGVEFAAHERPAFAPPKVRADWEEAQVHKVYPMPQDGNDVHDGDAADGSLGAGGYDGSAAAQTAPANQQSATSMLATASLIGTSLSVVQMLDLLDGATGQTLADLAQHAQSNGFAESAGFVNESGAIDLSAALPDGGGDGGFGGGDGGGMYSDGGGAG